ncbi:hypothetical protein ABZ942_25450 [Nocardia sp. NPDC046473]|uniref:hypothetical protein n=1 Tax=Nocardia sp. NPDC046473 TaxID=3155733 RepID=UPI0033F23DA8
MKFEVKSLLRPHRRVPARAVTASLMMGTLAVAAGVLAGVAHPAPIAKSAQDSSVITKNVDIPDKTYNCAHTCRRIGAAGTITVDKNTKKFTISLHLDADCVNGRFEVYLNGKTTDDKWWAKRDVRIYNETCGSTQERTSNFVHTGNWADNDQKVQLHVVFVPTIGDDEISRKVLVDMLN